MEETKIEVEAAGIIGIRFNMHDWYIAFRAEYISGEAISDNDENSEVLWMDVEEALSRDDVPELTKKLIASAVSEKGGLCIKEYEGNKKYAPYSLYCVYWKDKQLTGSRRFMYIADKFMMNPMRSFITQSTLLLILPLCCWSAK